MTSVQAPEYALVSDILPTYGRVMPSRLTARSLPTNLAVFLHWVGHLVFLYCFAMAVGGIIFTQNVNPWISSFSWNCVLYVQLAIVAFMAVFYQAQGFDATADWECNIKVVAPRRNNRRNSLSTKKPKKTKPPPSCDDADNDRAQGSAWYIQRKMSAFWTDYLMVAGFQIGQAVVVYRDRNNLPAAVTQFMFGDTAGGYQIGSSTADFVIFEVATVMLVYHFLMSLGRYWRLMCKFGENEIGMNAETNGEN